MIWRIKRGDGDYSSWWQTVSWPSAHDSGQPIGLGEMEASWRRRGKEEIWKEMPPWLAGIIRKTGLIVQLGHIKWLHIKSHSHSRSKSSYDIFRRATRNHPSRDFSSCHSCEMSPTRKATKRNLFGQNRGPSKQLFSAGSDVHFIFHRSDFT